MGRIALHLYSGEPTPEEILHRLEEQTKYKVDTKLWIRHKCPNCGNRNTQWLRQVWHVCYTCVVAFTTEDAIGYYDVVEYEMDEREEE